MPTTKFAVVKDQRVVNLDIPANVSTVGMGVGIDRWVDVLVNEAGYIVKVNFSIGIGRVGRRAGFRTVDSVDCAIAVIL